MGWHIVVACVVAGLGQLALHWLPWRLLCGRVLPRPAAYVLGTLGIALPLSGLLAGWGEWWALLALWAVVVAAGLAVLLAYLLDAWLDHRQARHEAEEREKALMQS